VPTTSSCFFAGGKGSGYTYYYGDGCSGSASCVDTSALCAAGTTAASSTTCYGNGWGLTLNQDTAGADAGAPVLTSAGLSYAVTALPPGGLQISVIAASGACSAAATAGAGCCAKATGLSGSIPWSQFKYQCWSTAPGVSFSPANGIVNLNFQSTATTTASSWNYCFTQLSY
jgi:hypothetical protein